MTQTWYKVDVTLARKKGKKQDTRIMYLFAGDILEVLRKRRQIRGTRREIGRGPFPNIKPLSREECNELERKIIYERRINLHTAKKNGYYQDSE